MVAKIIWKTLSLTENKNNYYYATRITAPQWNDNVEISVSANNKLEQKSKESKNKLSRSSSDTRPTMHQTDAGAI